MGWDRCRTVPASAWLLLSGCAEPRTILSLPPLEGVSSIVLLASDRPDPIFTTPDFGPIELETAPEADLFLLGFPCPAERVRSGAPVRSPKHLFAAEPRAT